jgi:hypothetical protein
MSEDKKPKKDLRARLGRTIAPNTPGAPPIAAPGGVIAPPAAAPAAAPTAAAPPAGAPAAAAPKAAAPIANPYANAPTPGSAKMPFGPDIAPPPFARPAAPAAEPAPAPRKRSIDPFAAGVPMANEVRLTFDEKPVDPSAGRAAGRITGILVTVGVVGGLVLGAGAGSVNGDRGLYNITVRDGHDVAQAVTTASEVVTQANGHLDAIAASARGGADHHPSVNYDEIAALNALEVPLHAGVFSRKNYNRFTPETVDDLFNYDHDVHQMWDEFAHLNAITSGPARRATLDATAAATVCPADLGHDEASASAAITAADQASTDAANAQYIALLQTTDDGTVQGTLGFAEQDLDQTTHQPTGRTFMRAGRSGPGRAFDRWTPGTPVGSVGAAVIAIDGPSSAAVLGDRDGAFRNFAESLEETRALMRSTLEIQGRLNTALAQLQGLQEQFSF